MSESHQQNDSGTSPILKKTKQVTIDSAIAMELPFTLVGAILLAGGAGYLLDHWLHTKPVFMLILGGLGFAAGIREVIRRLPGK
jgi:F0F1-type ATP synthase assembly protein I